MHYIKKKIQIQKIKRMEREASKWKMKQMKWERTAKHQKQQQQQQQKRKKTTTQNENYGQANANECGKCKSVRSNAFINRICVLHYRIVRSTIFLGFVC